MTSKSTVKTWRERIGFGPEFQLYSATDVERAMEAEIAELRSRDSLAAALLDENELAALRRFNETCEDGEGYDVPKAIMRRLAEIGVVRRTSGSYYEITEFGMCVLEQPAPAPMPNAFLPIPMVRVNQLLREHGQVGLLGGINLVRAVEQEVQQKFAVLGNCRRCEARGSYAGLVDKQLASVPCADCGGTGKTAAAMQAQQISNRKECAK